MYYLRVIGINRFAGGTDKWLKIRDITKNQSGTYTLQVGIRGDNKFVDVDPDKDILNLRFAKGWPSLMPVSFKVILQNF